MRIRFHVALLIGLIALCGCQLFEKDYGCPDLTVTPSPSDSTNLIGPTWVLQSIEVCDEATITIMPDPDHTFSFQFSDSGTVTGIYDCNGFVGKYSISDSSTILLWDIISHGAGCRPDPGYMKYLIMRAISWFDLRDETLRLIDSEDQIVWVLKQPE